MLQLPTTAMGARFGREEAVRRGSRTGAAGSKRSYRRRPTVAVMGLEGDGWRSLLFRGRGDVQMACWGSRLTGELMKESRLM